MSLLSILKALSAIGGAVKSFFSWLNAKRLKQAGRDERDLKVKTETVEVLARNNEAGNLVDQMDDKTVDDEFKRL